jgi:hypothetical protein
MVATLKIIKKCLTVGLRPQNYKKINFDDFCHDSAKQASLMAFAAPKVEIKKL